MHFGRNASLAAVLGSESIAALGGLLTQLPAGGVPNCDSGAA